MPGSRFDSEQVVAEFGDIQVHFQYALFRPKYFNQPGKPDFQSFAPEVTGRAQEQVLGDLLADRTGPPKPAAAEIGVDGSVNGVGIEPVMLEKTLVLGRNDRGKGVTGNLFVRHPLVVDRLKVFAALKIFDMPVQHEGRCRCRREPEQSCQNKRAE